MGGTRRLGARHRDARGVECDSGSDLAHLDRHANGGVVCRGRPLLQHFSSSIMGSSMVGPKFDQPETCPDMCAQGLDLDDASFSASQFGCGADVGGPYPIRPMGSGPPASTSRPISMPPSAGRANFADIGADAAAFPTRVRCSSPGRVPPPLPSHPRCRSGCRCCAPVRPPSQGGPAELLEAVRLRPQV